MFWFVACLLAGFIVAITFVIWRKWIAPWPEIERLVRQIGRGEQPRTFLVDGARETERVGIALEDIFIRQQELDQQLERNVAGQKAIFAAMKDPLLVIDGQRRLALFNRAGQELFSINDDSLDAPLPDTIRDPAVDELVGQTLQEQRIFRREIVLGNSHWQAISVPMGADTEPGAGAVVVFHDITELKGAEEMRRDLVANVSHELRTPLSILHGYIETLLDDAKMASGETVRILRVMEKHSNRLLALIEDLLTLAKLESKTPELHLDKLNLGKLLHRSVHEWEKRFAEKELNVQLAIPADLPPISVDEFRLEQLLANLLDNALKYSQPAGEVRVGIEQRENQVVLIVSDNGVGISKDDLPRIFERFYRADKGRSRERGGTGLGLSIVKHIAQLHGGTVEAESEPGKGTTIRVSFPIVTQT